IKRVRAVNICAGCRDESQVQHRKPATQRSKRRMNVFHKRIVSEILAAFPVRKSIGKLTWFFDQLHKLDLKLILEIDIQRGFGFYRSKPTICDHYKSQESRNHSC